MVRVRVSQASGSWGAEECCKNSANGCHNRNGGAYGISCWDRTASADFIFGLAPGRPAKFGPTGANTNYHLASGLGAWPRWGYGPAPYHPSDLNFGLSGGAMGHRGYSGFCAQGSTYGGQPNQICGGGDVVWGENGTHWQQLGNGKPWGTTQMEVWCLSCRTTADCSGHGSCAAGMCRLRSDPS